MQRETVASISRRSINSTEQLRRPIGVHCKFGTCVRALWPDKPALNLAQRIGCTERAAQYYIDGHRRPSLGAIMALLAEVTDVNPQSW